MKRILVVCLTLVLLAAASLSVLSVSAAELSADEQKIISTLKTGTTVPGTDYVYYIPVSYVNQAENYFLAVDTTAAQAEQIIAFINDGFAVCGLADSYTQIPSGDIASMKACLKQSAKAQILSDGQKACALVGLTLTYETASNTVIIKDESGKVVFNNTATVVKVTGAGDEGMAWLLMSGTAVVLTGAVVVVFAAAKKKNLLGKAAA